MILHVLGSSSKGNCYLLIADDGSCLIIEAGVHLDEVKQALDFNLRKVVGCIVTHQHQDHSKHVKDYVRAGIKVYVGSGHAAHLMTTGVKRNVEQLHPKFEEQIGPFRVLPFKAKHDVPCLGFVIYHPECGSVLFLTDSYYTTHKFGNLNNIIVEANYCENIIAQKLSAGAIPMFLRDRIIQSHMSIQTCQELLKANDLSHVHNIVLIHLSDSNSNEKDFKERVERQTLKTTHVASTGMRIPFNKTPF